MKRGDLLALRLLFDSRPPEYSVWLYNQQPSPEPTVWQTWHLVEAARGLPGSEGALDCIKYAVAHGCPWSPEVWGSNLRRSKLDILIFFRLPSVAAHCIVCLRCEEGREEGRIRERGGERERERERERGGRKRGERSLAHFPNGPGADPVGSALCL
jgi:hypothetical protein